MLTDATFVGILTVAGFAHSQEKVKGFTVLHEAESLYGWVRVVDDETNGFRLLLSDASVISAVDIAQGRSILGIRQFWDSFPCFAPRPRRPCCSAWVVDTSPVT